MARKLIVEIIGDTSSLEKAFGRADQKSSALSRTLRRLGRDVAIFGAAAVGTGLVLGEKFAKAALTAEEETGKLNKALELQHQSVKALTPAIAKLESAQRKLGFTNSETRQALTAFVTAGDGVARATREIGLAADLARTKNIDLTTATQILIRAHAGNLRALKGLGISLVPVTRATTALKLAHQKAKTPVTQLEKQIAKNKDAAATYALVTKELNRAIGGQAKEFSKSAQGGIQQFHAQLQNLEETLGAKLLPIIAKATKFLNDLLLIFSGSGSATDKFKLALERIGLSAKTTQRIIDDFRDTIATVKTVVSEAFRIMGPIVDGFFKLFKADLKLLDDLLHGRWSKLWGDTVNVIKKAVGAWKTVLVTAITTLGKVALKIGEAILHGIEEGLKGLGEKILDLIKGPINAVIKQINRIPFVNIPLIGGQGKEKPIAKRRAGPAGPDLTKVFPPVPAPHPVTGSPGRGNAALAPAGGNAVTINGDIHLPGVTNTRQFLRELQTLSRQSAPSRAGRFGGHNLGLA